MKSPIKYYGGKSYMTDIIKEHFPSDYKVYVEGFGGGASILFSIPQGGVEIYNDLGQNVYSLFKCLSDEELFSQLKNKMDLFPYSHQLRDEFIEDLKRNDIDILERGWKFLYVNRSSFNGVGGFSVSTTYVRRNMSKSVSDFLSMIDKLPQIHNRLSSVIVENRDINELLEKYDKEDTFFYLDPPYIKSTRLSNQTYECEMTDEQHSVMLDNILSCKGKFLISGYDNDLYNEKLKDWTKITFKSPNAKSSAIECLWKNY